MTYLQALIIADELSQYGDAWIETDPSSKAGSQHVVHVDWGYSVSTFATVQHYRQYWRAYALEAGIKLS